MGQYSFWSICRWLYRDGLLPPKTFFIGYARSKLSMEDIKKNVVPHMKVCVCAYVCVGALWGGCTLCVCACTFYVCVCWGGGRGATSSRTRWEGVKDVYASWVQWVSVHVWICVHISGVCVCVVTTSSRTRWESERGVHIYHIPVLSAVSLVQVAPLLLWGYLFPAEWSSYFQISNGSSLGCQPFSLILWLKIFSAL